MSKNNETHHALEYFDPGAAREIEDTLWWFQGRKHIIRQHLQKIFPTHGQVKTIMDIGCGSGVNLDVLAEFGDVLGVEPSGVLAERCRVRGIAKQIFELPAWQLNETRAVDLFTMFDVLEHIEDDKGFLIKLRESAADKHALLVSVPAVPFLYGDHDRLLSHHRRYSKKMLSDCLAQAGYELVSIRYYMFFLFPGALTTRLGDMVKSRLGFKRESVDLGTVPPLVNTVLSYVLRLESALAEYVRFPIGLWLFAIAKPHQQ